MNAPGSRSDELTGRGVTQTSGFGVAFTVGALIAATFAVVALVRGALDAATQNYLGQGLPMAAALSVSKSLEDFAAVGLAVAAVFAGAAWIVHQRVTAWPRSFSWLAAVGGLWTLARCLEEPLRAFVPWLPSSALQHGMATLLAAVAAVALLTRLDLGSSTARRVRGGALALLAAAAVFWAATTAVRRARGAPGPSAVVLVIDTLRHDHLGLAGYKRPTSPELDALARESVVFEHAYASAPWTSPSVAALLTSRDPGELGYADSAEPVRLAPAELTLPEILRGRGYTTEAVVSHTYVAEPLGFDQGFDRFDSENALGHHHISSPSVVDKALAAIDRRAGRPFFLFVHLFDPHFAFVQHDQLDFDPRYTGTVVSDLEYSRLLSAVPEMDTADIEHVRALYDSEIAYTDRHIGRLLEGLRERGLDDEVWLVVTADHGEAFLDRDDGWIGHGITLYDELVHVPLLIRPPAGSTVSAARVSENVGLIDVAPTILAALGVEPPGSWDPRGRALPLGGVVDDSGWARFFQRVLFAETLARGRWLQSAIWKRWKLVRDLRGGSSRLFDRLGDPQERTDVLAENPDVAKRLETALSDWHRRLEAARGTRTVESAAFSDEQIERLKALGYIE